MRNSFILLTLLFFNSILLSATKTEIESPIHSELTFATPLTQLIVQYAFDTHYLKLLKIATQINDYLTEMSNDDKKSWRAKCKAAKILSYFPTYIDYEIQKLLDVTFVDENVKLPHVFIEHQEFYDEVLNKLISEFESLLIVLKKDLINDKSSLISIFNELQIGSKRSHL